MKMKIEANETNLKQVEKKFSNLVNALEEIEVNLEDEREGDMWRMSAHTPDPEKVNKIIEQGLRILSEGFKDIRAFVYVDEKTPDNNE